MRAAEHDAVYLVVHIGGKERVDGMGCGVAVHFAALHDLHQPHAFHGNDALAVVFH